MLPERAMTAMRISTLAGAGVVASGVAWNYHDLPTGALFWIFLVLQFCAFLMAIRYSI